MNPVGVLLVEDHRMVAEALTLLLQSEPDIQILGVCHSAEEAVDAVRRTRPHVVVMDLDLPGIDGIEGTRRLRELHPETKVVVLTADHRVEVMTQALEVGASGYVSKARAAEDLIEAIRLSAAGEMPVPSGEFAAVISELQQGALRRAHALRPRGGLTQREVGVLDGLARGMSTAQVAEDLQISVATVNSHIKSVLAKLGVRSRLAAVLAALRLGIIQLPRSVQPPVGSGVESE